MLPPIATGVNVYRGDAGVVLQGDTYCASPPSGDREVMGTNCVNGRRTWSVDVRTAVKRTRLAAITLSVIFDAY